MAEADEARIAAVVRAVCVGGMPSTQRHRALKILPRLREQRRGQTEWLRDRPDVELV